MTSRRLRLCRYALGSGRIQADNPDSLVHQEILVPGQVWGMLFKERLQHFVDTIRREIDSKLRNARDALLPDFADARWFRSVVDKLAGGAAEVGKRLEYFLATGNLVSESGLDLSQAAGFTIMAERLNYWR